MKTREGTKVDADDLMHHFLGAHIRDYTDLVRAV